MIIENGKVNLLKNSYSWKKENMIMITINHL